MQKHWLSKSKGLWSVLVILGYLSSNAMGNQVLPNLWQSLQKINKGNVYGASQQLKYLKPEIKYSYFDEQVSLKKMVNRAIKASQSPKLSYNQKVTVMTGFVSNAISIMIRETHTPGITKKVLQTGVKHLRLAKLLGKAYHSGSSQANLVQAMFFLKNFAYAPAVSKAVRLAQQAYRASKNGNDQRVNYLTTQAIQTIKNSRIFNRGSYGPTPGHGPWKGGGKGKGKGGRF